MPIRLRLATLSAALGGLVACASIAGLDSVDPITSDPSDGGGGSSGDLPEASVTGDGSITTPEGISITPASLLFEFNCGATSNATITIKNDGDQDQPYNADIPNSTIFAIDTTTTPASGTVKAHDRVTLNVKATSPTPGPVSADVAVTAGTIATSVGITGDVAGAALKVEPAPLDFGPVRMGAPSAPVNATFSNAGNRPVKITSLSQGGNDFVLPIAPITVPAGGSATGAFVLNPGSAGDVNGTVSFVLDTVLCAGETPSLGLKGKRTNDTVVVSPTSLDLGSADCLSTPGTGNQRTVTLSNYDNTELGYTATLPANSRFAIVSGGQGPAPAGDGGNTAGVSRIVVGLKPPGNFYGTANDTLTVKPDGRDPVNVSLRGLLTGADMKYDTNPVDLRGNGRHAVTLRNVGNATVCVNYRKASGPSQIYTENDGDTFGANSVGDVGVYLDAYYSSTYTARVEIFRENCSGSTRSAPFCNPTPVLDVSARR